MILVSEVGRMDDEAGVTEWYVQVGGCDERREDGRLAAVSA